MRQKLLAAALVIVASTLGFARGAAAKEHGHNAPKSSLRTEPLPRPSGWIDLYAPNFRDEEIKVNIYNDDGSYNQEALAALDHIFRCKRSHLERAVDPRLYEILSIVYDHYGQQRIRLTSGYRREEQESRHNNASAMDISIDGVNYLDLYKFATTLDRGGMGIGKYPLNGFVHIDFRAPGAPSYYWTDAGGGGGRHHHRHHKSPTHRRHRNETVASR